jgi:hypothetical protein
MSKNEVGVYGRVQEQNDQKPELTVKPRSCLGNESGGDGSGEDAGASVRGELLASVPWIASRAEPDKGRGVGAAAERGPCDTESDRVELARTFRSMTPPSMSNWWVSWPLPLGASPPTSVKESSTSSSSSADVTRLLKRPCRNDVVSFPTRGKAQRWMQRSRF